MKHLFIVNPVAGDRDKSPEIRQSMAAKERFSPGARFMAIRAASMGMVPLPQKGSQNSSRPRYRDRVTMAAARVSRRGARLWAGR